MTLFSFFFSKKILFFGNDSLAGRRELLLPAELVPTVPDLIGVDQHLSNFSHRNDWI
jgi:hypothetical protein